MNQLHQLLQHLSENTVHCLDGFLFDTAAAVPEALRYLKVIRGGCSKDGTCSADCKTCARCTSYDSTDLDISRIVQSVVEELVCAAVPSFTASCIPVDSIHSDTGIINADCFTFCSFDFARHISGCRIFLFLPRQSEQKLICLSDGIKKSICRAFLVCSLPAQR